MRTVTTAKITAMRDAEAEGNEAEGNEARRVYDACLMRRSGRNGLRKIALVVGIPYETLRRRLAGCNSRKEADQYPDKRKPLKADAAAASKDAAASKPPTTPKIDGDALRKKVIYDQNGGRDSVTPENRKKLDAMSDEEVRENWSEWRARGKFGLRVGVEG